MQLSSICIPRGAVQASQVGMVSGAPLSCLPLPGLAFTPMAVRLNVAPGCVLRLQVHVYRPEGYVVVKVPQRAASAEVAKPTPVNGEPAATLCMGVGWG